MSSYLSLILVLITRVIVLGISLPGNCPKTAPTHLMPEDSRREYHLIRLVPCSSDTPTHMFRKISLDKISELTFNVFGYKDYIVIKYKETNEVTPNVVRSSVVLNGEWITLNSSIQIEATSEQFEPNPCYPAIEEDVKLWVDGDFMFLWTCRNTTHETHDEAVMIIAVTYNYYDYYRNRSLVEGILSNLQVTARKYLSPDLLSQIDWSYHNTSHIKPQDMYYDPFKCPPIQLEKDTVIVCASIFLLFVAIIGYQLWHMIKHD